MLEILNNVAGILTAVIAVLWFIYTRKLNYYEKGNITGTYKTFEVLIGRNNKNESALIEVNIDYVANKGWFTGRLDYAEIFRPVGARSEGDFNVIGFIRYNVKNDFSFFLKDPVSNPLEYEKTKGYTGRLFVISYNDVAFNYFIFSILCFVKRIRI